MALQLAEREGQKEDWGAGGTGRGVDGSVWGTLTQRSTARHLGNDRSLPSKKTRGKKKTRAVPQRRAERRGTLIVCGTR